MAFWLRSVVLALVHLLMASWALGLQEHQVGLHEPKGNEQHLRSRHAHAAELSYWEARHRSKTQREHLPATALTTSVTDLGEVRRIWDFYTPDYNCPLLKERIGRLGDGGKWVCGLRYLLQDRPCVVYSLGSAGDASFEEQILASTTCEVHTFDPTLSPDTQTAVTSKTGLHFHSIGLGRSSGPLESMDDKGMHSFKDVMAALGHAWVDVLKVDIEGHEWDMLLDFFSSGARLPATQLLVEFHWPGSAENVWKVLDAILEDGFRTFSVEPNYYCNDGACAKDMLEFAFIRVSEDGHVCSPRSHHAEAAGTIDLDLPEGC